MASSGASTRACPKESSDCRRRVSGADSSQRRTSGEPGSRACELQRMASWRSCCGGVGEESGSGEKEVRQEREQDGGSGERFSGSPCRKGSGLRQDLAFVRHTTCRVSHGCENPVSTETAFVQTAAGVGSDPSIQRELHWRRIGIGRRCRVSFSRCISKAMVAPPSRVVL